MSPQRHIVVIGAGVTGLQTSVSLLEAGYEITIIAKHFPGDNVSEYTSPWAGAHWQTHAPADDLEQQSWDTETYNHWLGIIARELNESSNARKSGLALRESRYLTAVEEKPWYTNTVLDFKHIPILALPDGIVEGHTCVSVMVNSPMYLQWLLDTALSLGATTIQETLPRSSGLAGALRFVTDVINERNMSSTGASTRLPAIDAFVNATGLAAGQLVPDAKMYPIRGQTVTVKGEAKGMTTIRFPAGVTSDPSDPASCYILPRPHSGITIIGGTKQKGNWNMNPDPLTTEKMLENAKHWAPELLNSKGEIDVVSSQVGLRPGREGGARVELEVLEGFVVCHAYGHAGAGYQNSVGSARKVVRLVDGHFGVKREGEVAKL